MRRRAGTDRQVRERAGGGVGGFACDGAPGRERGKRGRTGATVAAAPTLLQAAAAGVAPTGQCRGAGGGGKGCALPAGGAVRGAGAHGAPAPSPPAPGAGTRNHLPAGDGVRMGRIRVPGLTGGVGRGAQRTTQWRAAERGSAGWTVQRQKSTAASGREGKKVGGSDVDRQAARCRAGVRDKKNVVGAGILGTVRKGKERDRKGSIERDKGRQNSTEYAATPMILRAKTSLYSKNTRKAFFWTAKACDSDPAPPK